MIIHLSSLEKKFGDKIAVDIPDFRITDNEILGLVGNNGAGKTTLFRLILDLVKADKGNILISSDSEKEAIDPAKSEAWKPFTGAYIDDGFLIDFLTPEEYFHFIGKISGLSEDETNAKIESFEPFMGGEILNQKKLIRDFSAGNKQKIGIISAMLNTPKLLILDEPFNFLDPTSQNVLKRLLQDYKSETGAAILISSHNLNHVIDISDRIALLEHGRIIKDMPNVNKSAEKELDDYFNIKE